MGEDGEKDEFYFMKQDDPHGFISSLDRDEIAESDSQYLVRMGLSCIDLKAWKCFVALLKSTSVDPMLFSGEKKRSICSSFHLDPVSEDEFKAAKALCEDDFFDPNELYFPSSRATQKTNFIQTAIRLDRVGLIEAAIVYYPNEIDFQKARFYDINKGPATEALTNFQWIEKKATAISGDLLEPGNKRGDWSFLASCVALYEDDPEEVIDMIKPGMKRRATERA